MEMPLELKKVWAIRAALGIDPRIGGWFTNQYEMAMARVEDHRGDASETVQPYVLGPSDQHVATAGEIVYFDGGTGDPEDARKGAFELLVLADMAQLMELHGDTEEGVNADTLAAAHPFTPDIGKAEPQETPGRSRNFESLYPTEVNYNLLNVEAQFLHDAAYSKGYQDAKTDVVRKMAQNFACSQMELATVALAAALNGEKPSIKPMANMARRILNMCPLVDQRIQHVITLIGEAGIDEHRHRSFKREKLDEAHVLSAKILQDLGGKR